MVRKYKDIMRACSLYALSIGLVAAYPLTAFATDSAPTSDTSTTTPASTPKTNYTYDPATGRWNTDQWQYDGPSGTYESVRGPVTPPPTAPTTDSTSPQTQTFSDSTQAASNAAPSTVNPAATPAVTSTQSDATTSTVANNLLSQATTGDATIHGNTLGGSAQTGNATASATAINTIHSSVQGNSSGVATFTSDINGDVNGDLTLYPTTAGATGGSPTDSTIQMNTQGQIVNNLTLGATSGDAEVSDNTTASNATSGSANTVANVINLINSIIASNKSFVGTINIYGNLDGDILLSPSFIPQLLGSNAPSSTDANLTDNQSITNNISLSAITGQADVSHNTTAGDATTGTAKTNLTVFNFTGHQVVASDSLLVFVNVLGKWVGMIVDAPPGATAAALGSGVSSATGGDQTLNGDTNSQIVNNIQLASRSGDASVTGNTTAGNATSGDATASANIANISDSSFSLSDWFGVLFINVFGNWIGSFGVDTSAGDPAAAATASGQATTALAGQAFQMGFIPQPASKPTAPATTPVTASTTAATLTAPLAEPSATLASAVISHQPTPMLAHISTPQTMPKTNNVLTQIVAFGIVIAIGGVTAFGLARK